MTSGNGEDGLRAGDWALPAALGDISFTPADSGAGGDRGTDLRPASQLHFPRLRSRQSLEEADELGSQQTDGRTPKHAHR